MMKGADRSRGEKPCKSGAVARAHDQGSGHSRRSQGQNGAAATTALNPSGQSVALLPLQNSKHP